VRYWSGDFEVEVGLAAGGVLDSSQINLCAADGLGLEVEEAMLRIAGRDQVNFPGSASISGVFSGPFLLPRGRGIGEGLGVGMPGRFWIPWKRTTSSGGMAPHVHRR